MSTSASNAKILSAINFENENKYRNSEVSTEVTPKNLWDNTSHSKNDAITISNKYSTLNSSSDKTKEILSNKNVSFLCSFFFLNKVFNYSYFRVKLQLKNQTKLVLRMTKLCGKNLFQMVSFFICFLLEMYVFERQQSVCLQLNKFLSCKWLS